MLRIVLFSCLVLLSARAFAETPASVEETILLLRRATTLERAQTILLGIRTERANAEKDVLLQGGMREISQLPLAAQQALIVNSNVRYSDFQEAHWDGGREYQAQWKETFEKGAALRVIDRVLTMESLGFKRNILGLGFSGGFTALSGALLMHDGSGNGVIGIPLFGVTAINFASRLSRTLRARAEFFQTIEEMKENGFPIPEDVVKYANYFEKPNGGRRWFPHFDRDYALADRLKTESRERKGPTSAPVESEPTTEISDRVHNLLKLGEYARWNTESDYGWKEKSLSQTQWTKSGPDIIAALREVKEKNLVLDARAEQTLRDALLLSPALRRMVAANDLFHGPHMNIVQPSYPEKQDRMAEVLFGLKGLKNANEVGPFILSFGRYIGSHPNYYNVIEEFREGFFARLKLEGVQALEKLPEEIRDTFTQWMVFKPKELARLPGANPVIWQRTFRNLQARAILTSLAGKTPVATQEARNFGVQVRNTVLLSGVAVMPFSPLLAGVAKGAGVALEGGSKFMKYLPTPKRLSLVKLRRLIGNDLNDFPKDIQESVTALYEEDPQVRRVFRADPSLTESCEVALGAVSGR